MSEHLPPPSALPLDEKSLAVGRVSELPEEDIFVMPMELDGFTYRTVNPELLRIMFQNLPEPHRLKIINELARRDDA